jgi:hypothetical protein
MWLKLNILVDNRDDTQKEIDKISNVYKFDKVKACIDTETICNFRESKFGLVIIDSLDNHVITRDYNRDSLFKVLNSIKDK